MEQSRRFLELVERVLCELPCMFVVGTHPQLEDCPWGVPEVDTTLVRRKYEALPKSSREAMEPEWIELGVLMGNVNAIQTTSTDLFLQIASRLGIDIEEEIDNASTRPIHRINGRARLAVVRNEGDSDRVLFVGNHENGPGQIEVSADNAATSADEADSDKVLFIGSHISVIRQTRDDRGEVEATVLGFAPTFVPLGYDNIPCMQTQIEPTTLRARHATLPIQRRM